MVAILLYISSLTPLTDSCVFISRGQGSQIKAVISKKVYTESWFASGSEVQLKTIKISLPASDLSEINIPQEHTGIKTVKRRLFYKSDEILYEMKKSSWVQLSSNVKSADVCGNHLFYATKDVLCNENGKNCIPAPPDVKGVFCFDGKPALESNGKFCKRIKSFWKCRSVSPGSILFICGYDTCEFTGNEVFSGKKRLLKGAVTRVLTHGRDFIITTPENIYLFRDGKKTTCIFPGLSRDIVGFGENNTVWTDNEVFTITTIKSLPELNYLISHTRARMEDCKLSYNYKSHYERRFIPGVSINIFRTDFSSLKEKKYNQGIIVNFSWSAGLDFLIPESTLKFKIATAEITNYEKCYSLKKYYRELINLKERME
ncbi:hypothetical protein KKF34_09160 [Myxococcota bacterium]|nr:hypothetical protein [Myxococcota bacterium]MBU1379365.1 hypothetical protein [Myxococcota bacterium]MBU1497031.1 hypothetical protein [Myxococcota bacterium]